MKVRSRQLMLYSACIFVGMSLSAMGYGEVKKIVLTLPGYLQRVAKSNMAVMRDRENINIARAQYHEARDIHSPLFDTSYYYEENRQPNEEINQGLNFGAQAKVPITGTLFRLELTNSYRIFLDSDSLSILFSNPSQGGGEVDPQWTSGFLLRVEQPLLRGGAFVGGEQRSINLRKKAIHLEEVLYTNKMQVLLLASFSLFWQTRLYQQNLQIAKQNLKDTQELLRFTQKKVNLGTADEAILYDLESLVVNNQDDVSLTQKNIRHVSFQIAHSMGKDVKVGDSYEVIIAGKPHKKPVLLARDREGYKKKAYELAMQKRQDLKRSQVSYSLAKENLKLMRLTAFPLLNVNLRLGYAGRDESQGEALRQSLESLEDYNYYVGLRYEMPLNPLAFKTVYERAHYEERKAKQDLDLLYQEILLEIEEKVDALEYHHERMDRYERMMHNMTKRLNLYKKDFKIGKVNADRLKGAYDSLRDWQRRYLSSILEYELAYASLQIAEGSFLDYYNIPK